MFFNLIVVTAVDIEQQEPTYQEVCLVVFGVIIVIEFLVLWTSMNWEALRLSENMTL